MEHNQIICTSVLYVSRVIENAVKGTKLRVAGRVAGVVKTRGIALFGIAV